MELLHRSVTEQIIGAAFEVHKILGYGFLESVYQHSMAVELQMRGLRATVEAEIDVTYKGVRVGCYRADLLVNECVLVELQVAKEYHSEDEAQLLNELKRPAF